MTWQATLMAAPTAMASVDGGGWVRLYRVDFVTDGTKPCAASPHASHDHLPKILPDCSGIRFEYHRSTTRLPRRTTAIRNGLRKTVLPPYGVLLGRMTRTRLRSSVHREAANFEPHGSCNRTH